MRKVAQTVCVGVVLALGCPCFGAEILRAESVLGPANANWEAFARASLKARQGEQIRFILPDRERATYQQMRRALWLAALHGLTEIECPNAKTAQILTNELARAVAVARKEPAVDVAVRDVATGGALIPLLVKKQVAVDFAGATNACAHPIIFRCKGTEAVGEKSGLVFTSLASAASFASACQTAKDFICEEDGDLAPNVFVRRFRDGTTACVNLTDEPRPGLVYQHGFRRLKFDLQSGDVLLLRDAVPEPFSQKTEELFVSGLWKVTLGDGETTRIVPTENIGTFLSESYFGPIAYETTALVPQGTDILLTLDTGKEAAEVFLDGKSLGTRAWEPFEWRIPGRPNVRRMKIGIRLEKRTRLGFLLSAPTWRRP